MYINIVNDFVSNVIIVINNYFISKLFSMCNNFINKFILLIIFKIILYIVSTYENNFNSNKYFK